MNNLGQKKKKQLEICLGEDVEMEVSNGFEKYQFVHQALPETDFDKIDTSIKFLGKKLKVPILISSMAGGTKEAGKINRNLASAAQKVGVGMGIGSQRVALETKNKKQKTKNTYQKFQKQEIINSFKVRNVAPEILLLANFGAIQLNHGFGVKEAERAVSMIGADGLILHLNPLQEALQVNGQANFKGVLTKIKKLVNSLNFPIIVKEIGCGISYQVAKKLYDAGVKIVDTAGAGGTSWPHIEYQISNIKYQNDKSNIKYSRNPFKNWGIPTAESLIQCKKVKGLRVIASGGIRNGIEMAKAIALGADMVGIGLPLLKPAQKGEKEVEKVLNQLIFELKLTMFCVGAENIKELKRWDLKRNKN